MTETGNTQGTTERRPMVRRGGARLDKADKKPNKIVWAARGIVEVAYKPQRLNKGSLKRHNFWRYLLYIITTILVIAALVGIAKVGKWYSIKVFNETHPATIITEEDKFKNKPAFGFFPVSYAMAAEKEVTTNGAELGNMMAKEILNQPKLLNTMIQAGNLEMEVEPTKIEPTPEPTPEPMPEPTPEPTAKPCEFVLDIAEPDPNYQGSRIELTDEDRYEATCIIAGEDNAHGFEGAVLVAQALHDAMETDGYKTIRDVRINLGYTGWNDQTVSQSTLDAIDWVFDQGNAAVQHRILYFYSANGGWHETQHFIVELGNHRFFDRWN